MFNGKQTIYVLPLIPASHQVHIQSCEGLHGNVKMNNAGFHGFTNERDLMGVINQVLIFLGKEGPIQDNRWIY